MIMTKFDVMAKLENEKQIAKRQLARIVRQQKSLQLSERLRRRANMLLTTVAVEHMAQEHLDEMMISSR